MFLDLFSSFMLGLLTPLTAVCVLPLYPGFLVYLTSKLSQNPQNNRLPIFLGIIISLGVMLFMFLFGLIFTTILQVSLTKVIGIVSPIAFSILGLISILLIFNVDIGKFLPKIKSPVAQNPVLSALTFGFFFGAIVIPCNPLFIAALFAKTIVSSGFLVNMLHFVMFGAGIAAPLLVFAFISSASSSFIISRITRYKRVINFIAGIIMLAVSIYYLFFVFKIFS